MLPTHQPDPAHARKRSLTWATMALTESTAKIKSLATTGGRSTHDSSRVCGDEFDEFLIEFDDFDSSRILRCLMTFHDS